MYIQCTLHVNLFSSCRVLWSSCWPFFSLCDFLAAHVLWNQYFKQGIVIFLLCMYFFFCLLLNTEDSFVWYTLPINQYFIAGYCDLPAVYVLLLHGVLWDLGDPGRRQLPDLSTLGKCCAKGIEPKRREHPPTPPFPPPLHYYGYYCLINGFPSHYQRLI